MSARHAFVLLTAVLSPLFLLPLFNSSAEGASAYTISTSASANRSSPTALAGKSVAGNIHVFVAPASAIKEVRFYLDDTSMAGPPRQTERVAAYDFAGTAPNGLAIPFDTTTVGSYSHTITAAIDKSAGGTDVIHATFSVANYPLGSAPFAWSTKASAPLARFEAQGGAANGKLYVFGGLTGTGCCIATARADAYNPTTNTWGALANVPEALTHSAVAVDGTTVYLVGGFVGDGPGPATTHVWKYNTGLNTWSAAPSLPAARGAGAAAIVGRELHFFGGLQRTATSNVDKADHYVLALDGGTAWTTKAAMPNARNHLAGASVGGKVYAIGGQHVLDETSGNQTEVDVYNPATNTWTQAASLPAARGHVVTAVLRGRILAIGGTLNGNIRSGHVTSYDPATNQWLKLPSLPDARKTPVAGVFGDTLVVSTGDGPSHATASTWSGVFFNKWDVGPSMPVPLAEVAGGIIASKLYIVGSVSPATLAYDLATGVWSSATSLARRPYPGDHHAAEVFGGKLYLFGGLGGADGNVQIFNPATNSWTLGADMPSAAGSSSSAVIGNNIYVAGGIVGASTTTQVGRYAPATNTWTLVASMKQGRNHAASATDGSKLYVFGGRGPGSGDGNMLRNGFDTVQIYDPSTNTWVSSLDPGSTLARLPQARGGMGKAVYLNGEFYVIGGETSNAPGATPQGVYNRVDIYKPSTNTWRAGTLMPSARHGIFPLLRSGRIHVDGGGTKASVSSSSIAEALNAG